MSRVENEQQAPGTHQAAVAGRARIDVIPDIPEGEPFAQEWKAFRSEVHRLISEGKTGKFAVLKGNQLVGVWDTLSAADLAGRREFGGAPFLVQEIQLYLKPMRWG